MVPPGFKSPRRSASSTMAMPTRSLIEPPGLRNSALASTVALTPRVTAFSCTSGVLPTVAMMCGQISRDAGATSAFGGVFVFVFK